MRLTRSAAESGLLLVTVLVESTWVKVGGEHGPCPLSVTHQCCRKVEVIDHFSFLL